MGRLGSSLFPWARCPSLQTALHANLLIASDSVALCHVCPGQIWVRCVLLSTVVSNVNDSVSWGLTNQLHSLPPSTVIYQGQGCCIVQIFLLSPPAMPTAYCRSQQTLLATWRWRRCPYLNRVIEMLSRSHETPKAICFFGSNCQNYQIA